MKNYLELARLLRDAADRLFSRLIVESLDRQSRDQADLATLYKRLTFLGIEIREVHGEKATPINTAVRGLVGAIYLADLADKTRRGLSGRVRDGLSAGGRALIMATDWDAIAWHSKHPERMKRVLTAFAPHCADITLPRTLGKRLREAGFNRGRTMPYPIFNPAWKDDSYSCCIILFITSYVKQQRTLSNEELDDWAAEQTELGKSGEYYFLSSRIFFEVMKSN